MPLQDYTTDELRAEIKRRMAEERKSRPRAVAQYVFVRAKVTLSDNDVFSRRKYRVEVLPEDEHLLNAKRRKWEVGIHYGSGIKRDGAPQVGDIVLLRDRQAKSHNAFSLFSSPKIWEVVKREGGRL